MKTREAKSNREGGDRIVLRSKHSNLSLRHTCSILTIKVEVGEMGVVLVVSQRILPLRGVHPPVVRPRQPQEEHEVGVRVRMRLSWMMTPHQLRTVDPAVEPLRAGTALGSGVAKKDIACNFAEFHDVHIFDMLFLLEKLASRVSSDVELSLRQRDRGVIAQTKKFLI